MDFDENIYEEYSDNESIPEENLYLSLLNTNSYYGVQADSRNHLNSKEDYGKYFSPTFSQRLIQTIHGGNVGLLRNMLLLMKDFESSLMVSHPENAPSIWNKQLSNGNTLLMEACEYFEEEALHCLVEDYHVDINYACICNMDSNSSKTSKSNTLPTAIHLICSSVHSNRHLPALSSSTGEPRSVAMAHYLLRRGVCLCNDTDVFKTPSGNGVLHCAVLTQSSSLVRLLLDYGCDMNVKNSMGNTALMLAAELGNEELCQILVNAGADKNVDNISGQNALQLSVMNGHFHLKQMLMPLRNEMEDTDLGIYYAWAVVNGSFSAEKTSHQVMEDYKYSQSAAPSDLTIFCCGLGLYHLIPTLSEVGLDITQLASMSETQLTECGVTKFIDRRRILDIFQRLHKSSWGCKKWPSLSRDSVLSLIQMLNLVVNIRRQLSFIGSSLVYVRENLIRNETVYVSQPEAVVKPVMNTLLQFCEDSLHNCHLMNRNANQSESLIEKMLAETQEDRHPDLIEPGLNEETESVFKQCFKGLTVVTASLGAGYLVMSLFFRSHKSFSCL